MTKPIIQAFRHTSAHTYPNHSAGHRLTSCQDGPHLESSVAHLSVSKNCCYPLCCRVVDIASKSIKTLGLSDVQPVRVSPDADAPLTDGPPQGADIINVQPHHSESSHNVLSFASWQKFSNFKFTAALTSGMFSLERTLHEATA